MSKADSNETIGEELFIEELGEVRGGAILVPGKFITMAYGLGEGASPQPRPWPVKPAPVKPPRVFTTLALGEEGTSVPHTILPMGDD